MYKKYSPQKVYVNDILSIMYVAPYGSKLTQLIALCSALCADYSNAP